MPCAPSARRYRRCSRLLGMLHAAVTVLPWSWPGALAQTTVAADETEVNATIGKQHRDGVRHDPR